MSLEESVEVKPKTTVLRVKEMPDVVSEEKDRVSCIMVFESKKYLFGMKARTYRKAKERFESSSWIGVLVVTGVVKETDVPGEFVLEGANIDPGNGGAIKTETKPKLEVKPEVAKVKPEVAKVKPEVRKRDVDVKRVWLSPEEKAYKANIHSRKQKYNAILQSYMCGEELKHEDLLSVSQMLQYHPEVQLKIGCGLKTILVDVHGKGTKCFFLVRTDGTRESFSLSKCILNAPLLS